MAQFKRIAVVGAGQTGAQLVADLLGRLHDQKIFYRPKTVGEAPYVSG